MTDTVRASVVLPEQLVPMIAIRFTQSLYECNNAEDHEIAAEDNCTEYTHDEMLDIGVMLLYCANGMENRCLQEIKSVDKYNACFCGKLPAKIICNQPNQTDRKVRKTHFELPVRTLGLPSQSLCILCMKYHMTEKTEHTDHPNCQEKNNFN